MLDENNIVGTTHYETQREDGQRCPVELDIDKDTGEIKATQKSAPFYAFNKENWQLKRKLSIEQPFANTMFEFFVQEMDGTNAISISMATLEKIFGKSRQTLSKHIAILVENKFISVFKQGNMNVYAINANIVWTQGDKNLWKAKFKATIYLDYDEQTEMVKREYSKKLTVKKGR